MRNLARCSLAGLCLLLQFLEYPILRGRRLRVCEFGAGCRSEEQALTSVLMTTAANERHIETPGLIFARV